MVPSGPIDARFGWLAIIQSDLRKSGDLNAKLLLVPKFMRESATEIEGTPAGKLDFSPHETSEEQLPVTGSAD